MCTIYSYRDENKKLRKRFYVRIPKSTYRIKYTRAYITHSKRIDPELESELDLLEQQLYKSGFYKVWQDNSWRNYWVIPRNQKEKQQTKKQLKTLKQYPLKDIINEKISWEKN